MDRLRRFYKRLSKLNRNTKLAILLGAILLVVGILAISMSTNSINKQKIDYSQNNEDFNYNQIKADITLKEGTLEYENENSDWIETPNDYKPREGSTLRTVGASSRSIIQFEDGSQARMDANTEIEIKSQTSERVVIKLIAGHLYNRVSKTNGRVYIIESNDAQYEALGTAFESIVSGDEQSVRVYQNVIHETVTNEKPNEGEKLTVINQNDPTKNGKIEKLDIELIKKDAFIVWNRDLDLKDEKFKNQMGFLNDFEGPTISVESPNDGSTVLLEPEATEATAEFKGKTESGTKLTILSKSQAGSSPVDISVGQDGNFTSPFISTPIGSSVFEFVAKDRTGNKTSLNIRVNFQKKSAPVATPPNIEMTLSNENTKHDIKIDWRFNNDFKPKNGVRIIYSKSSNPTFEDKNSFSKESSGNSYTVDFDNGDKGDTYYFRICSYDSATKTCNNYSTQASIEIK